MKEIKGIKPAIEYFLWLIGYLIFAIVLFTQWAEKPFETAGVSIGDVLTESSATKLVAGFAALAIATTIYYTLIVLVCNEIGRLYIKLVDRLISKYRARRARQLPEEI